MLHLAGAKSLRDAKVSEVHQKKEKKDKKPDDGADNDDGDDDDDDVQMQFSGNLGELWHLLKQLVTNPTYVFATLFNVCDAFLIAAFTAYGPKYLENQFRIPSSLAGVFFGKSSSGAKLLLDVTLELRIISHNI